MTRRRCDEKKTMFPRTCTDYYGLLCESSATFSDYRDIFEETPIYALMIRMVLIQLLGWQILPFSQMPWAHLCVLRASAILPETASWPGIRIFFFFQTLFCFPYLVGH